MEQSANTEADIFRPACLEILHIEDDVLDAKLIEDRLDTLGFEHKTTRVTSGEAFLIEVQKNQAQVVLSDSGLCQFSAFDALSLVRRKLPDVPFIFLSGNASPDLQRKARQEGAYDYVVKDRLADLPRTIRRACIQREPGKTLAVLPRPYELVIVRCPGFQCMAYLDKDGNWRDQRTAMELPEVFTWFTP